MENNITERKNSQRRRVKSVESIHEQNSGSLSNHLSRSVMLDSTTRSLPNTTCLDSSIVNQLKNQIEVLQLELDSAHAHQEISNLNDDNRMLKQQIKEMSTKIDVLIKISTQTAPNSCLLHKG